MFFLKIKKIKKSFDHKSLSKANQRSIKGGFNCCPIPPDDPPKDDENSTFLWEYGG